jgi:hypothetical protein
VPPPRARRSPVTRLAALAALLSLLALLGACGGEDDDGGGGGTAAFCDEIKSIFASDDEGGGGLEQQAQRFRDAIRDLQKVDPPEEIAEDWNTVMKAWDAEGAADFDPEAVQKSGKRLTTYMRDECGISDG